jgi:hypothetical protein
LRTVRSAVVVTVFLVVTAAVAVAQTAEFVVVNRTGATIYFLYASASNADTWGEDLLGRTVLPDGDSRRVRLRSPASSIDVRAVDANDNEYTVWKWDARPGGRVVLTTEAFAGARSSTPAASASDAALSWITIVNDTNYTVVEVHVVPSGGTGSDGDRQMLPPGQVIHAGEEYRIEVDTGRFGTLVYDVMLVDEDGDRYVKSGVNLEVTIRVVYTLDDLRW